MEYLVGIFIGATYPLLSHYYKVCSTRLEKKSWIRKFPVLRQL